MWPQITWLLLVGFGLGVDFVRDGNPKEGKVSFAITLLGSCVGLFILLMGGFFDGFFY